MENAPSAYTKPDMIIITSVRPGPINEDESAEEARSELSGKARFKTVREELARIVANACTTPDHQIAASQ
ncbi:hypothetical protein SUNI508_08518 [Seiridium unicorne]|uniref:Uncharacterized protein n=1 Tax=Seiridium unicorne TaxID=138068 RepID=A0ABR2UU49_9PEZI